MKRILIYSIIVVFFTSCAVLKKDKTTTTKQTEKIETATDTTSKETVNQKIDDEATFKVAEVNTGDAEFDRRVNQGVINALKGIDFQKSSGDNSYRFYYDEQLKALRAEISLGETRNKEVSTNKEALVEKTFEENVSEYIKKIVIPWWMKLIGVLLLAVIVFVFAKVVVKPLLFFVSPQLRGLKTMKDIITPPNK